MSRVLLIGEPMALFIAQQEGSLDSVEDFKRALAGAEVNVAIGLKRLGHEPSYMTKLGDDPFGKYVFDFLEKEGIDASNVVFDKDHPTGFMLKSRVSQGDPKVFYFRRGSAASTISPEDISKIDIASFDRVHVTGITPALSMSCREAMFKLIEIAKEKGVPVSFDPNLRPTLWKSKEEMVEVINRLASKADMVLPGISEGNILTGSEDPKKIAEFYINLGVKTVVIKVGSKGAYVRTNSQEYLVEGYKVEKVVDTVGAGDGFAVGIISGLLENLELKDAVKRGNAIGALQVMAPGDNDGLPDRSGLSKFMNK